MIKLLRHLKDSFRITRRNFLASISIAFLSYFIRPVNYAHSIVDKNEKYPVASNKLLKREFKFFNPYQATVVEEVTSLIIPTDELNGAKEAGVVFEIDNILSGSNKNGKLYIMGLKWLDYMAGINYKKRSFLDLGFDDKIEILKVAESGNLPEIYDKFPGRKRISEIVRIFFEVIKQHSFEVFYTSRAGWEAVGYKGPPQWFGNRDYYECPGK